MRRRSSASTSGSEYTLQASVSPTLDRRGRLWSRRGELVPEHDFAVMDLEGRHSSISRRVAAARLPVAEHKGGGGRVALRRHGDDLAGTGKARVETDSLGVRPQEQNPARLNDLGSLREQAGGALVVSGVERVAPSADDALGRPRTASATRWENQHDEEGERGRESQIAPTIVRWWTSS
jgi:hypothetical protein